MLALANGFIMLDAFSASDTFENLWLLILPVQRHQNRNRFADDLFGYVAEDSLRALIPTRDDAIKVLADDCVVTGLYNGGNALRRVEGQKRLVGGSREDAQVGHHAQVFRVEAATRVVRDNPNCAAGLTLDVEGNQQSFLKDRLDGCPIGE